MGLCAWVAWGAAVQAGQPSKHPPAEERGEQLFRENCWHCHGKRALGDGPLAKAGPVDAPALAGRVPEQRDDWVELVHRGQGTMPAFAPVMDRSAVRSIMTWLEALDAETGAGPSLDEKAAEKARKEAEQAKEKAKDKAKASSKEATDKDKSSKPTDADADQQALEDDAEGGAGPREAASPAGDRL